MSFRRLPGAQPHRTKAVRGRRKKKPEWDSTVSDLSVYKATPEEIKRRREAHRSTNLDLIREREAIKAAQLSRQMSEGSSRLLREVLHDQSHDQSQLEETLLRTDKALAVVKDLFGDNAMRYQVVPTVTTAPNKSVEDETDRRRLDALVPSITDGPTKLDLLNESVQDKTALNDVETDSSAGDDSIEEKSTYQEVMDLRRFKQYLEEEQAATDPSKLDDTSFTKAGAINDTAKVKRTKSRLTGGKNSSQFSQGFGDIDAQLRLMERRCNSNNNNKKNTNISNNNVYDTNSTLLSEDYTGYADSVMEAISRISSYLKETEEILVSETNVRQQLMDEVVNIRTLTDVLTNEFTTLRDSHAKLEADFIVYRNEAEGKFNYLMSLLKPGDVGHDTRETNAVISPSSMTSEDNTLRQTDASVPVVQMSPTVDELASQMTTVLSALPTHVQQHQRGQAIPLSPPRLTKVGSALVMKENGSTGGASPMTRQIAELSEENRKAHERLMKLQKKYGETSSEMTNSQCGQLFQTSKLADLKSEQNELASKSESGSTQTQYSELPRTTVNSTLQNSLNHAMQTNYLTFPAVLNGITSENTIQRPVPEEPEFHGKPRNITSQHPDLTGQSVNENVAAEEHKLPKQLTGLTRRHFGLISQTVNGNEAAAEEPELPTRPKGIASWHHDPIGHSVSENEAVAESQQLAKQIDELTKQHSDAQNKLQQIIDRQRAIHLEKSRSRVSPSISPIPTVPTEIPVKDKHHKQWVTPTQSGSTLTRRAITVSVPQVDTLSVTPSPNNADMRTVPRLLQNNALPGGDQQNYLGLAAHVGW